MRIVRTERSKKTYEYNLTITPALCHKITAHIRENVADGYEVPEVTPALICAAFGYGHEDAVGIDTVLYKKNGKPMLFVNWVFTILDADLWDQEAIELDEEYLEHEDRIIFNKELGEPEVELYSSDWI